MSPSCSVSLILQWCVYPSGSQILKHQMNLKCGTQRSLRFHEPPIQGKKFLLKSQSEHPAIQQREIAFRFLSTRDFWGWKKLLDAIKITWLSLIPGRGRQVVQRETVARKVSKSWTSTSLLAKEKKLVEKPQENFAQHEKTLSTEWDICLHLCYREGTTTLVIWHIIVFSTSYVILSEIYEFLLINDGSCCSQSCLIAEAVFTCSIRLACCYKYTHFHKHVAAHTVGQTAVLEEEAGIIDLECALAAICWLKCHFSISHTSWWISEVFTENPERASSVYPREGLCSLSLVRESVETGVSY